MAHNILLPSGTLSPPASWIIPTTTSAKPEKAVDSAVSMNFFLRVSETRLLST